MVRDGTITNSLVLPATLTRSYPIYAGLTQHDGQDVIGLGLSPQAARDAVLNGIGELEQP